jgi:hypothetical protein
MVVSLFAFCFIAKLDRLLGAQLQACETLLIMPQPGGLPADPLDITDRADLEPILQPLQYSSLWKA